MKKQIWGKWKCLELTTSDGMPVRVMIQIPYDWHRTHDGNHTKKYWAKYRAKNPTPKPK